MKGKRRKEKGERGWRDGTLSLFILLSIPQKSFQQIAI
jgi:hypothetical protein